MARTRTAAAKQEPAEKAPRRKKTSRPAQRTAESTKRVMRHVYGQDQEVVESDVHVFETEPAYVRVNAGMTKNLGNYESLRIDVAYTVPCYQEDIDATTDSVADEVAARLDEELDKYLGEAD